MSAEPQGLCRLETVMTGWVYVRVRDSKGREYELTEAQYRALGWAPDVRALPLRFAADRSYGL